MARAKSKSTKSSPRFAGIPHTVMHHPDYISLSPNAIRLLLELAMQFNGYNNGDLSAAWTLMKKRGFRSQTTLNVALQELMQKRLIERTREGRFLNPGRLCALYALAWQPVHACPGKQLEIGPTIKPLRSFALEKYAKPSPISGANRSEKWSQDDEFTVAD